MLQSITKRIKTLLGVGQNHSPIYIFDLDGTLALTDARNHYIAGANKDWDGYFKAAVRDKPNQAVIFALYAALHAGCEVWIWSGRSDSVREETIHWLSRYIGMKESSIDKILTMRCADDRTPDDVLKESWFKALPYQEQWRICAAYDDRDSVVAMWRKNNIPCFQVAAGDF